MKKFYGYKKCSTSRKAQKFLDDHGINYEFQDLVAQPPTEKQLLTWLKAHQDRGLRYFFNTSGQHYRQMHLKDKIDQMTIPEAAQLLAQDGKLIKRPLLVEGDKLTCGFNEKMYQKEWL